MRPDKRRDDNAGFSLIELMVVVLIIGLSLSVLFNLDYSGSAQVLRNEARAFANTAALVMDEAALSGDPWGIDFYLEAGDESGTRLFGYRWLRRQDDAWHEAVPVGMEELAQPVSLAQEIALGLTLEGLPAAIDGRVDLSAPRADEQDFSPEVWLFPNHESTAFALVFRNADAGEIRVSADPLGRMLLAEDQ